VERMMLIVSDGELLQPRLVDCEVVLARESGSSDSAAPGRIAHALVGKGDALVGLGRNDEAAECFEQAVAEFGDSLAADLREQVVDALARLVHELVVLGRIDEAVARANELDDRFGDARKSEVRAVFVDGLSAGVAACDALAERNRWTCPGLDDTGFVVFDCRCSDAIVFNSGWSERVVAVRS